jgi:DNA replication protein DnaC
MVHKQANATESSAAVVESIIDNFQACGLTKLTDPLLYMGMPPDILENLLIALCKQRAQDEQKRFINRMRYAGISKERSVETFRWDAETYPLAEPGVIESALCIDFVKGRKNLIAAGPPGTGKTLFVTIIACTAIRAGISVMYKSAHDIAIELKEARVGNSMSGYIKKLSGRDVLIIEDVTFAAFDKTTAQAFFSVLDKRYGKKTTIVTANGNIGEWAKSFPDKHMSSAILGRLYEDALLVNMNGAKDRRLSKAKALSDGADQDERGEGSKA